MDWIPMKWPSGPLEVSHREKGRSLTPQVKETLRRWHDPSVLDWVQETPINCLIVSWAVGLPQDGEQQRSLAPILKRGQQMGLSFVGSIDAGADGGSAIASAQAAGLAAVAVEEDIDGRSRLPVILRSLRSNVKWASSAPILSISENLWPQVQSSMEGGRDSAVAGPTGVPWVNSNGWFIQLARALGPNKEIWLTFEPPQKKPLLQAESYMLALADTAAYGARWVISLDDNLRGGLANKSPEAMEAWKKITRTLIFFKSHPDWRTFRPQGMLGVVSDFAGANAAMSGEVLNLLSRRHLPFRILLKSQCLAESVEGLKAILWVDPDPPEKELRRKLLTFVEGGGLVIVSPTWGKTEGAPSSDGLDDRYEMRSLGQGYLALAREEFQDPYRVATEAQLLLSRRNDLVRLWNAGAMNAHYTSSSDGKRELVQIVNYSARSTGDPVSLWIKAAARAPRLWSLQAAAPFPVQATAVRDGIELHLPSFSVYLAIELENEMKRP